MLYNSIYIFFFRNCTSRVFFISRIYLHNPIFRYIFANISIHGRRGTRKKRWYVWMFYTFDICLWSFVKLCKAFFFLRVPRKKLEVIGRCYFIISILFSIGNHNIHCTKQKFIFGISRTLCILRMRCAWNLKVKFSHHLVSLSTHLFHFIILWCFLLHPSIRDLLTSYVNLEWCMYICIWCVCMTLVCALCVCMCVYICMPMCTYTISVSEWDSAWAIEK